MKKFSSIFLVLLSFLLVFTSSAPYAAQGTQMKNSIQTITFDQPDVSKDSNNSLETSYIIKVKKGEYKTKIKEKIKKLHNKKITEFKYLNAIRTDDV
ncbi:hypothetical protein ACT3HK_10405 [Thermolongibacillus altinsuensis]